MSAKPNRPSRLSGRTHKWKTSCGNLYITVNRDGGAVKEVMLKLGKAGNCVPAWSEALSRVISIALQCGADVGEIQKTLMGIRCHQPWLFPEEERVLSCPDCVASVLMEELNVVVESEVKDTDDREVKLLNEE